MVKNPKKQKLDLSAFKKDHRFKKHFGRDADHSREYMEGLFDDLSLGMSVALDINMPSSSLRYVLDRDRDEAAIATIDLVECDFNSVAGVERAKALQSRVIRYRENVIRLAEAIAMGDDAAEMIQQHQNEELQDGVSDFTDESGDFDGERPV